MRVTYRLLTKVEHRICALVGLAALTSLSGTSTPITNHHMGSDYATTMPPVKQSANPSSIGAQWKDRAVNYFVSEAPSLYRNRIISSNKSDGSLFLYPMSATGVCCNLLIALCSRVAPVLERKLPFHRHGNTQVGWRSRCRTQL